MKVIIYAMASFQTSNSVLNSFDIHLRIYSTVFAKLPCGRAYNTAEIAYTFDPWNVFVFCGQGPSCWKIRAHITVGSYRQESED